MKILVIVTLLSSTTAWALQNNVISNGEDAFTPRMSADSGLAALPASMALPYGGVSNSTYTPIISNAVTNVGTSTADTSQIEVNPDPFASGGPTEEVTPQVQNNVNPAIIAPIPAPASARPAPITVANIPPATATPAVNAGAANPLKINLQDLKGSEPATTENANHATLSCKNITTAFQCMACNCVNEAKAGRYDDMLAVSLVVMTRKNLRSFPDTVCGVVKQASQFSWYNKMSTRKPVPKGNKCFKAADQALTFRGYFADHYHAAYVNPKWARNMRNKKVVKIGTHTYYMNAPIPRTTPSTGTTVEV